MISPAALVSFLPLAILAFTLASAVASAQSSPPGASGAATGEPSDTAAAASTNAPAVRVILENLTRAEQWSFFRPRAGGGDPDYPLFGNRATLGMAVDARRIAFQASFRYAQMVNLPRRAAGPGPLGPGGAFYAAARGAKAYQLFFKSMSLRVKDVPAGVSFEGGRMAFESGAGTPVAGRLIGNAEWTMFERAFDGARVDIIRPRWTAHASFLMPTQGAYEESANPTMGKVQVATASWTRGSTQLFAHHYRDTRPIRGRPDNTGRAATAVNLQLQTVGAMWARPGRVSLLAWGALQGGRWYDDRHRAFSGLAEAGYQWSTRWRPALRAGASVASGDNDPADARHGTFFPMLPTTSPGVLSGTFAQMNLRDIYATLRMQPRSWLLLMAEAHRFSLADALDRWYSGTGATAAHGTYFGFSERPSRLATNLGTLWLVGSEARLHKLWTLNISAGLMQGGDVIQRQFDGRRLSVFVLENRIAVP